MYTLLLNGLINVKKLFATNSKKYESKGSFYGNKIFCAANTDDYNHLKKRLQQYFKETAPLSVIDNSLPAEESILFCEPYFSFKQIIETMEHNANRHYFFIHANDSKCIIGSADKTMQGIVFSLE